MSGDLPQFCGDTAPVTTPIFRPYGARFRSDTGVSCLQLRSEPMNILPGDSDALSSALPPGKRGARTRLLAQLASQPLAYLIIAIAGLIVHLIAAHEAYDTFDRLLSWALIPVVLYIFYTQFTNKSGFALPLLVMVAAEYYITYGMPVFSPTTMDVVFGVY